MKLLCAEGFLLRRDESSEIQEVALGKAPADLVVRGGTVVNTYTRTLERADVAVKNDRIVTVGEVQHCIGQRTHILSAEGKYLTPGLIDAHVHVAGFHVTLTELARALIPHGTTAITTDFYEMAAVAGVKAVRFCLQEAAETSLKVLFLVPVLAYMQNRPFGFTGRFSAKDLKDLVKWPEALGLCEPQPQYTGDPIIRDAMKETLALGKIIEGHACELSSQELDAYLTLGASSDHESTSAEEASAKVRLGMRILVREGSAAADLERVIRAVGQGGADPRLFMFCTDEETPVDLWTLGHMDHKIRMTIEAGVSPVAAVQMATLSAAEYLRVDHGLGSISPGKTADILLVDDLDKFTVSAVIADGKLAARNGQVLSSIKTPRYPRFMRGVVALRRELHPSDFAVKVTGRVGAVRVRIIGVKEGYLISERLERELKVTNGVVQPVPEHDVLKISDIERHNASGRMGTAFISGFGLKEGAMACTYSPVCQNLVVLGADDADMALAVNELKRIGGGFIVVGGGKILHKLKMSILGIMSDKPLEDVKGHFDVMHDTLRRLGCSLKAPFLTLAFMAYPPIPTYKISEYGLVEVDRKLSLFLNGSG
ncbi:MAG: adenine deaminase [Candidatus Bathyarchaeia archaeon]